MAIHIKQNIAYHCKSPQNQQVLNENQLYSPYPPHATQLCNFYPSQGQPKRSKHVWKYNFQDNLLSKYITLSRLCMLKGGV